MPAIPRMASRGQAQSLVEFALVVPLFLLILFALIDFGRLEFSYVSLANATREMARSAAIEPISGSGADVATSSDTVNQSFMNYQGLILSDLHSSASNTVTIMVYDKNGVLSAQVVCSLPIDLTLCSVPSRFGVGGGYVDIASTFQFGFSPLFQNRLTGMIDASFMTAFATLSTTARAYIE